MVNHPSALILAAGLGKRMKSDLRRCFTASAKISCEHVLLNLADTPVKEIGIVVGHKQELWRKRLELPTLIISKKTTRHGACGFTAQDFLKQHPARFNSMRWRTLQTAHVSMRFFPLEQRAWTLRINAILEEPGDYGRINPWRRCIAPHHRKKDSSEEELKIKEINAGTYCFDSEKLLECLSEIQNQNSQNEYIWPMRWHCSGKRDTEQMLMSVMTPMSSKPSTPRWNCRNAKVLCAAKSIGCIGKRRTYHWSLTVYIDRGVSIEAERKFGPIPLSRAKPKSVRTTSLLPPASIPVQWEPQHIDTSL